MAQYITFRSIADKPVARKTVTASGLKSAAKTVLAAIAAATMLAAPMLAHGAEAPRKIVDRKTCVAVVSFDTDSQGRTVITKSWSCEKIENAK